MASPANDSPLLELRNVVVSGNRGNIVNGVDFSLWPGEIHGLVGDRGTGKTTLGRLAALFQRPGSGQVLWKGEPVSAFKLRFRKPRVQILHQQDSLIEYFTVAENMFLPERIFRPFPFLDRKRMLELTAEFMEERGFRIDPSRQFNSLSMSERVTVEFLRCVFRDPELLVLDEALEKLSGGDLDKVVAQIRTLADRGTAILCISHRIDDVYGLAGNVSVIRDGKILLTSETEKIDRLNLIKLCYMQVSRNTRAEDINREFYQLLRYNEAILRKLPICLLVTDDADRIKMLNDEGQRFFKVPQDQFLNNPISSLIRDREILDLILQGFNKREESALFGKPMDGVVVNVKIFPIFDGTFPIGNITIIEDVTEQEKMRQRINLSENLASLGLLAAGVAHEINNPLEIIYNYINFLRMNPGRGQLLQAVDNLEEEIDGIKHIISTLVSFSGNKQHDAEPFDINHLISETLVLLTPAAKQRGIECRFAAESDELVLRANKTEIRQVLMNLIKNSFEVLEEGGRIVVSTATEEGLALVRITDDGPGIAAEDSDQIFLPFYSTKKHSATNLGLGLSMSYGLIKKHGGTINFRNLSGGGCEFTVALPALPPGIVAPT